MRAHGGGRPPVTMDLFTVRDSFGQEVLRLRVGDEWIQLSPDMALGLAQRLTLAALDLLDERRQS